MLYGNIISTLLSLEGHEDAAVACLYFLGTEGIDEGEASR